MLIRKIEATLAAATSGHCRLARDRTTGALQHLALWRKQPCQCGATYKDVGRLAPLLCVPANLASDSQQLALVTRGSLHRHPFAMLAVTVHINVTSL